MKFPYSKHATALLSGLKGVEIGGAAHNPFGLDTINVDRFAPDSPEFQIYAQEQTRLCGEVMPIGVVACGDNLPFDDNSFDFVISSHVIEHFFDPIAALMEWRRVARKYIYIICPQRDALQSDRDKPLTTIADLTIRRLTGDNNEMSDEHHSRWTSKTFVQMCRYWSFEVIDVLDPDDKVGNGFTVVIDASK
jgi:SAM-dependent methyltransferase